jgi:hypothetical protein
MVVASARDKSPPRSRTAAVSSPRKIAAPITGRRDLLDHGRVGHQPQDEANEAEVHAPIDVIGSVAHSTATGPRQTG